MSTTTDIMKCSRCGREISVTEPGATGWEAIGDGREVTCEACITLEKQGQIDATIIDITAGTDTEALFGSIRQEQADLAAVLEPEKPPLADRVAEARAMKSERDNGRALAEEHRQAEEAEEQRVRTEKIAAGLLGKCPSCQREVDTAGGIVLRHLSDPTASYPFDCEGIGEISEPWNS